MIKIYNQDIEQINKEIEEELNQYNPEEEEKTHKKQFLTFKFFGSLVLVILVLRGIVQLFF